MTNRLIALFAAVVVVVLAGCNTMEGAGRDIERGGEKIQDAAGKAKKELDPDRQVDRRAFISNGAGHSDFNFREAMSMVKRYFTSQPGRSWSSPLLVVCG